MADPKPIVLTTAPTNPSGFDPQPFVAVGSTVLVTPQTAAPTVTSPSAVAAVADPPTKAEYDAVVTLVNEIKTDFNSLVAKLTAAGVFV